MAKVTCTLQLVLKDFLQIDGKTVFPTYKKHYGYIEKLLKIMNDWLQYSALLNKIVRVLGAGKDLKSGKTVNIHGKICWERLVVPCMAAIKSPTW